MINMNKRVMILVGLPACGKSTWRNMCVTDETRADWVVISSDDLIEQHATALGVSYNDVFQRKEIVDLVMLETQTRFNLAVGTSQFIMIDRTNVSVKSRAAYIELAKANDFKVDAIVFARPETQRAHNEWNIRLNGRTGKTIPNFVLQNMYQDFTYPTKEEGFDNIVDIDTFAGF